MIALKVSLFTQLLRDVGYARMEVSGCSMLPAIRPGDVIRVESSPARMGDIILFLRDGHLCAHRFLAEIKGHVVARGDANRKPDAPFPYEQILGRVISLERNGVVITDLAVRPLASLIIRNNSLIRRLILRILDLRSKRALRPEANSLLAKSKA